MPYINVYVDTCDLLDGVSDEDLIKECESRKLSVGNCIPRREARQSCIDASDFLNKTGRIDLSHRLDEIKTDYLS